ncbi:MAG: cytochrome c oxidase subunit 3 [Phycisphaerae bacterium]
MADVAHGGTHDAHGDGHGHSPFLAHHFDSLGQQFSAGKLGMWLFLSTEILLFGGLFCAYAVYRANHPEVFMAAHHHLDKVMGGINTIVLILSSFTMAWAVTCSQRGNNFGLKLGLFLTLLGGCGFMGIKYIEYKAKIEHGLLWGKYYHPSEHAPDHGAADGDAHGAATAPATAPPANSHATTASDSHAPGATPAAPTAASAGAPAATPGTAPGRNATSADPTLLPIEPSAVALAPVGPRGVSKATAAHDEVHNQHLFFSIYFAMTGLHGLHVLAGMGVIGFLLWKSFQGAYGPEYFTPVDLGGLYWHLVDLIWIFLFPLLYLIH